MLLGCLQKSAGQQNKDYVKKSRLDQLIMISGLKLVVDVCWLKIIDIFLKTSVN